MKNPQQLRDWCNRDGSKSSEQARIKAVDDYYKDRENEANITLVDKVFILGAGVFILYCSTVYFW